VRVTASASLEPRNSVADALRACAAAILRRDPSTWGHFAAALSDAPTGALEPLLRAAGDAGDARSFDTLRSVLSGSACPVAYTLDALASVAARIEPPFDASLREQVRAHLGAGDPQAARAAAVVAGKLEDVDAVSELIELLESGDPAVGRAAHGALQAIGRMSFRADPRRWRSWHAGEVEWWENESPSALRRLHGDDGPEAIRSIGEMVSHRLHRHELAVELAELLGHEDPAMRRVACAGLGQMGSGLAVPELVLALDDDDETVRAAASGALQVLTGRVLGADPDAWRAVLESGAGRLVK
jgi:HEAT repeat protein